MAQTIEQIKTYLKSLPLEEVRHALAALEEDERPGVCKLKMQYEKKCQAYEKELERIEGMRVYEKRYKDAQYICGIDEVGRGPLAGPVVTAAVILPKDCIIPYVNDSKKLSEKKREELYEVIMDQAVEVSFGMETAGVIDEINILQATYRAMKKAVDGLKHRPDVVLVDAVTIPGISCPQVPIIKGDAKSISIAAASIVAKVTRDRMMKEYDLLYPQYDFASNKGYGTKKHLEALREYGPSPIHRDSFLGGLSETEEEQE